jgi:Spy/CpxP family protein refolding chaperone
MKLTAFLLPLAMAGLMAAQTTPAPQTQKPANEHTQTMQQRMMHRMTARLNLTEDQQTKAKTIFAKAHDQQRALAPKLKEERTAIHAAIKTDNEAQIDQILQQNSQLNLQAREIHTKAVAQFYQILTPAQKTQFDHMMTRPWNQNHRAARKSSTGDTR